jgi:glycine oxidase
MIFGAGIAGLSAATAALKRGLKTLVIDINKPGFGASGTPMALLNPAAGRKAKKTWEAEKCLLYTKKLLDEAGAFSRQQYYHNNGVIRPALDKKIADGMIKTFQHTEWPQGWIEWLNKKELNKRFPGLNCEHGGLWIPAGGTVSMKDFIQSLYLCLQSNGVDFQLDADFNMVNTNPIIVSDDIHEISANIAIYATGKEMTQNSLWEMLPLHRVKGQTLTVQLNGELEFESSVSSLGYIAQLPSRQNEIILGSTYEHHFDHFEPDRKGADYLIKRLCRTFPELINRIKQQKGWAGVRVTVPDKKPVIGSHPDYNKLYTICALGSKGLMLGPYLGKLLIDHIVDKSDIPEIFSIERVLK